MAPGGLISLSGRSGRRARRLLVALGLLGGAAFLAPTAARAHETGPFQVFGAFREDGGFRLEIKVDEEHLPPGQMGGPARRTRYGRIAGLDGPAAERFGRFLCDLVDSLTLSFDGAAVRPTLAIDREALAAATGDAPGAVPARVILDLDGWIPGGARRFTLRSSLPVRTYPVVLRNAGDEVAVWRWVAGGEVSPPFALAPRVVPPPAAVVARAWVARGFAAVLPHGPVALLLVAAVFLLAGRPGAALLRLAALGLGQAAGLLVGVSGAGGVSRVGATHPNLLGSLLALAVAVVALVGLLPARRRGGGPPPAPAGRLGLQAWQLAPVAAAGILCGLVLAGGVGTSGAQGAARAVDAAGAAGATGATGTDSVRGALGVDAAAGSDGADGPQGPADGAAAGAPLTPPLQRAAALALGAGALGAELLALAAAVLLVGLPLHARPWYRDRVVVPAGCLIVVAALYRSVAPLLG